jgi:hypothetical protein
MIDKDHRQDQLHVAIDDDYDDAKAISLIEEGIDVDGEWENADDGLGAVTPLYRAGLHDRPVILRCLLKHGTDANKVTGAGHSPLSITAQFNSVECLSLLVELGRADLDKLNGFGEAGLHNAASGNQLECAAYLVSAGCLIGILDEQGNTALVVATKSGYHNVSQFLEAATALSAAKNYRGLDELCRKYSPFLKRRLAEFLHATLMECLRKTKKKTPIEGIIAPCSDAGVTLTPRVWDHEEVLARIIMSYVGPKQGAPCDRQVLNTIAEEKCYRRCDKQIITDQQQTISGLQQTIAEQQQTIAELQQTIAELQVRSACAAWQMGLWSKWRRREE